MGDWIDSYTLSLVITIGLTAIQALGLYIITGLSGQISLGHAAFGLCGAYAAALLNTRLGLPPWLTIPSAGLIGAAFGLLLGFPSLRVRDDFLAIVTLGFGLVIPALLRGSAFFGGTLGISAVQFLTPGSLNLALRGLIVLGVLASAVVLVWRLERSWQGLIWRAMIDDELAASACGVDVQRAKLLAFSLGAAISAVGGALFVHHVSFVNSDTYTFDNSIIALAMVVIGASSRLKGVLGAVVVLMLMFEFLRALEGYRMTIYGLLLLLMMQYRQYRLRRPLRRYPS